MRAISKVLFWGLVIVLILYLPPLSFTEQKAVKTLIDDFMANDDPISPNWQWNTAVVRDPSGNFVLTWQDERDDGNDIYAQRYDSSGIALGSNFKVNDDPAGAEQWYPAIGMDGYGNFIIAWRDERDGNNDIYAQRYGLSGTPLGSNFKVNDDADSADQDVPAITSDAQGNFVIVWQDDRNGNYDIYAQRYSPNGTPLGSNFKVNDDLGTLHQYNPVVAKDGSGNFVVAWEDYRSGLDIYAQRYSSNGNPQGSNFKVNDEVGSFAQYSPAVIKDYPGNFVITWQDNRNTDNDIYAQRYDSSGAPLGSNFKVNDDSGSAAQDHPAIAVDGSANFIITWRDRRDGNNQDVYAQRYDSSATALGVNFKVNEDPTATYQRNPAVAADSAGNFIIAWEDWRNGIHFDVYAQRYDSSGAPLSINFMVNDDVGYARQDNPDIAVDGDGDIVITWKDYRFTDYGDIVAQRFNSSGIRLGSNFTVNDTPGVGGSNYPAVASDSSGNFVVTWEGWVGAASYPDVYARRYSSSGIPLGPSFRVDDDITDWDQTFPAVAMNGSGNFVIAWTDYRLINYDIYAQRFNSSGTPLGVNFKVNGDAGSDMQIYPAVAMGRDGKFIITWIDSRYGDDYVLAKIYGSSGNILKYDFIVNDMYGSVFFPPFPTPAVAPSIAIDDSGNFVIAWTDERNEEWGPDIYAQRFNSQGYPIGSNFRVNDDTDSVLQWSVSIASDDRGNFVVTWADKRNGDWDIYAQKYDSSGTPLDTNYLVPNLDYVSFAQEFPRVAVNGSNIYFTWVDDRRGGEWDVYAKVVEANWPTIRGDANGDGVIDIADASYLTNYLFVGGPAPDPFWLGDANCDGEVDIGDASHIINYLFMGGPSPGC